MQQLFQPKALLIEPLFTFQIFSQTNTDDKILIVCIISAVFLTGLQQLSFLSWTGWELSANLFEFSTAHVLHSQFENSKLSRTVHRHACSVKTAVPLSGALQFTGLDICCQLEFH